MITFFTLAAALVTLSVFVSYPDTGPLGSLFAFLSIPAWCACFIFTSTLRSHLSRSNVLFINTAVLMASLLSAFFFMPQGDNVSVFDKLALEQYPTRAAWYRGLKRLGIDYPALKPPEKPQEVIEL